MLFLKVKRWAENIITRVFLKINHQYHLTVVSDLFRDTRFPFKVGSISF